MRSPAELDVEWDDGESDSAGEAGHAVAASTARQSAAPAPAASAAASGRVGASPSAAKGAASLPLLPRDDPTPEEWGKTRLVADIIDGIKLSQACNSEMVQRAVRAAMPAETLALLSQRNVPGVLALLKWVRRSFRVDPDTHAKSFNFSRLTEYVLVRKQGTEVEICQLIVAAARSVCISSRLVLEVRTSGPPSESLPDVSMEFWLPSESGTNTKVWHRASGSAKAVADTELALRSKDQSKLYTEPRLSKSDAQKLFMLAFGELDQVTDVTARYRARMSEIHRLRAPFASWLHEKILDPQFALCKSEPAQPALEWAKETLSQAAVNAEQANLVMLEYEESMPTSVAGFKNHPTFALASQLRTHEHIKPGAEPCTVFKGHSVFHRNDVEQLRTELAWKKEGRIVRKVELDHPAVAAKRAKVEQRSMGVEEEEEEEEIGHEEYGPDTLVAAAASASSGRSARAALYSLSQTSPVQPGMVAKGKLPLNEYGNVDYFHSSFLPEGAAFVDDEGPVRAYDVAVDLELECARALVDFTRREGRATAVFRGAIVLANQSDFLTKTVRDRALQLRLEAQNRARARAVDNWWTLLASALVSEEKKATVGVFGHASAPRATCVHKWEGPGGRCIKCGEAQAEDL